MNVNAFFTILKMNKRVKCDRILYSSAFNFNVIHAVYLKKKRITCVREEDVSLLFLLDTSFVLIGC